MRQRLAETNINAETFLATDYLNHFNEVVMVIELVADMPDALPEVLAWQPKSYVQHFRDSTFRDRELAVAAYELAPAEIRLSFDQAVAALDDLVGTAAAALDEGIAAGDTARAGEIARDFADRIRHAIDVASAIINGRRTTAAQDDIDALFEE